MKSQTGTPYTSIRHRDNQTVSTSMTPERAVEDSLSARTTIPREHPMLDQRSATTFTPATEANAEDRIGLGRKG